MVSVRVRLWSVCRFNCGQCEGPAVVTVSGRMCGPCEGPAVVSVSGRLWPM